MQCWLALLGIVLAACSGKGPFPGLGKVTPPPPPAQAAFAASDVRSVDTQDRPAANDRVVQELPGILGVLNDYYNVAFLDPGRWGAGAHPDLPALFTAEAAASVGQNLGALALADLAPKVRRVDPTRQEAFRVSVQIEDDLSPPLAVLSVAFEATGSTVEASDGPLQIVHNATYWLAREGDAYRIAAYTVELRADTAAKAASGRPVVRKAGWGA